MAIETLFEEDGPDGSSEEGGARLHSGRVVGGEGERLRWQGDRPEEQEEREEEDAHGDDRITLARPGIFPGRSLPEAERFNRRTGVAHPPAVPG
jgi:hypothetical protein